MSEYNAPLKDINFVMQELAELDGVLQLPGNEEFDQSLTEAITQEAAKFAGDVLSPLNWSGDQQGASWKNGEVTTADGWKNAYTQFCEAGWTALACDPEYGGQGLPQLISTAVTEMWNGANISFTLCPMLTNGAIEAITLCGTPEQKKVYLEKMVTGVWTGTMNLTEPQAGSDLAAVRAKAEPQADGTYRISGQKVFITYGDHDLTENIVHLVLARLPDAPEGVKGISLFVVPKYLVNQDGSLGERNDIECVSIEHKLGIHASPTCVLAFGDKGGAIGELVGEANRGLEYMFIMMNEARFGVGMEGLAVAERAYQKAVEYAKERIQGTEIGTRNAAKVAILKHPDVRRMLLTMKSKVEAMRALCYVVSAANDMAHCHADEAVRKQKQAFVDLMIPVVKGWCTENSIDIASLGVQVHGGMGYVEETGAAQYLRDARITTIYEGTTAIQANDLLGRKVARDGGAVLTAVINDMRTVLGELENHTDDDALKAIAKSFSTAISALASAGQYIATEYKQNIQAVSVGSVPFLMLFGIVAGGWQMARAALVAQQNLGRGDAEFLKAKIVTARFYADHVLPAAEGMAYTIINGAQGALDHEDAQF